jgi:hypothetical protein
MFPCWTRSVIAYVTDGSYRPAFRRRRWLWPRPQPANEFITVDVSGDLDVDTRLLVAPRGR